MLTSTLFGGNVDLENVAAGMRVVLAPEQSDTVALIQQALLAVAIALPDAGIDGIFGDETGTAVSSFKFDRSILPADPIVGRGTTARLDLELTFLDGRSPDPASLDVAALRLDPFIAGLHENQLGDLSIGDRLIQTLQFGERFCFRASMLFDNFIAIHLGRFIEQFIFDDFCKAKPPCPSDEIFFDRDVSATPYVEWLQARNPLADPGRIAELAQIRRPDILIDRDPTEWWEIKPQSISGAIAAWIKFNAIIPAYAERGLPYLPGRSYQPNDIVLGNFLTPEGEHLSLILEVRAKAPGLLFWTLCVKGDWVSYFNRVRLAAGIAALLTALVELAVPAAEAGAIGAALNEILRGLPIGVLPILQRV